MRERDGAGGGGRGGEKEKERERERGKREGREGNEERKKEEEEREKGTPRTARRLPVTVLLCTPEQLGTGSSPSQERRDAGRKMIIKIGCNIGLQEPTSTRRPPPHRLSRPPHRVPLSRLRSHPPRRTAPCLPRQTRRQGRRQDHIRLRHVYPPHPTPALAQPRAPTATPTAPIHTVTRASTTAHAGGGITAGKRVRNA